MRSNEITADIIRGRNLSRRDFLRTTGMGAAALALPEGALAASVQTRTPEGGYEYAAGEVDHPVLVAGGQ